MNTINNNIPFVPENTVDPAAGLNLSLNQIDALLQVRAHSVGTNTPPAGVEGQRHIVGTAPTGAWAGQANKLARFLDGAWSFYDARIVLGVDGVLYVRPDATWLSFESGGVEWGEIGGMLEDQADLVEALGEKVDDDDARLTDAREWTATEVSQAEAEAGTATTARKWTSLRVFQAIAAWWAASSAKAKLDGIAVGATANATDADLRDRATHTGTQSTATIAGLDTALAGKQATLVSGTNVKTLNGASPLGSGNLALWDNLLTPAIASGALALDLTNPAGFAVTLNANITSLSFSNVPTGKFLVFAVAFLQDATGGRTIAWPSAVKGSPSQPSAAANALTIMSFATWDGGSNIYQAA